MTILHYELQRKNSHEGTYRLLSIRQYDSDSTTGAVWAGKVVRLFSPKLSQQGILC
jgi:hypothetical protein